MSAEYRADEQDGQNDRTPFETRWDAKCPEFLAEDAAHHYWYKRGGYDSEWPLKLEIFFGGISLGAYNMEAEARPHFVARRIKQKIETQP